MKRLLILFLFVTQFSFSDWPTAEEYHKKKDTLAKQAAIANTCAFLIEHDFADTKLKQANCMYNIELYFDMLNEVRKIENFLSSKNN